MEITGTGKRIIGKRTNTSITTPWHIHTNDKEIFRIYQMPASDQPWPPVHRITVCGECMKYPYYIRFISVHFAERVITKMEAGYYKSRLQFKWILIRKCFECQFL